jgi:NADH-quinone oxidoreductase subunit E
MSRVLAGFPDGRADEGVGAGGPSLAGLRLAREHGWTAPAPATEPEEPLAPEGAAATAAEGEPGAGEPGSSAEREPTGPQDTAREKAEDREGDAR